MRFPVKIMRSFRFRILALVLTLVTAVVAGTVAAVASKAHAEVARQAAETLRSAADTAREVLKFRGNQLSSAVGVLTSDFGFKEAIGSGDEPTLLSAMANHRARIGADLLIVLNPGGRVLASTASSLSAHALDDLQSLVVGNPDGEMLRLYRLIDGRPYQLVLAPVLAPDIIAWTAMGFALDDKVAADMAPLLGVDVAFIASDHSAPTFVASSRRSRDRSALAALANRAGGTLFFARSDHDELLTWTSPIRSANGSLTLVLQRSMSVALSPYVQLRSSILWIGCAIFAAASALAFLLARSATRPVDEFIVAVERLEAGDYDSPVPKMRTNEFLRLSTAFDAMRGAVAERERIIRHHALHDPLTGLPNRLRMIEVLDEWLAAAAGELETVTVFVVQVVDLQHLTGSLGHVAADEVLREISKRLLSRDYCVGIAGADQFLVLMKGSAARQGVLAAERIVESLGAPFEYAGAAFQVETRVGVAGFPLDASKSSELLQLAELALYNAAESSVSVGAFRHGDVELQQHRLTILGDLRRAIVANELELHFQPKVSLFDGRVSGCEVLVRWRHPSKGLIAPGEFIPHAERTGLIRVLTSWVLDAAFRQLADWQGAGFTLDMAINVSPADLADARFADSVVVLLRETRVDPAHVIFEVTESGAMKDLPNTLRVMEELRVIGVRFSIDDFGTGYSSLAHLRRLPVDEIKIDRSFVHELEKKTGDDVILRSTINLGHALNLKVVAEGVENAGSCDVLKDLGCDLVQGYFISKPLSAANFVQWVTARGWESSGAAANRLESDSEVGLILRR